MAVNIIVEAVVIAVVRSAVKVVAVDRSEEVAVAAALPEVILSAFLSFALSLIVRFKYIYKTYLSYSYLVLLDLDTVFSSSSSSSSNAFFLLSSDFSLYVEQCRLL